MHAVRREEAVCDPLRQAVLVEGIFSLDGLLEHGVAFFNVLRAHKMQHWAAPGRPEVYAIGGHLDWTVVASTGAETLRIWEWPDVVGEKIRPELDGKAAAWMEAA